MVAILSSLQGHTGFLVDRLLGGSEDYVESGGIFDSHVRENLAVNFDLGGVETFHEAAVCQPAITDGSGDTSDPETAELTLTFLTITVLILPSLVNSVFSVTIELRAESAETLGTQQNTFATSSARRSICSTRHGIFV